ncbi:hypothetical protein HDU93_006586, partial [Gonapodya sp. JEL0774]
MAAGAAGLTPAVPVSFDADVGSFSVTLTVYSFAPGAKMAVGSSNAANGGTGPHSSGNQQRRTAAMGIVAEHKDSMQIWRAEFTADYIEDITRRTGNFKKYPVFVEMLASALNK